METTVVSSYVRRSKQEANQETKNDNIPTYVLLGTAVLMTAIVYWQIAAPLALVGSAGYVASKLAPLRAYKEAKALIQPVDAPKPKRHYQHRITVNHYQRKTVKI